MRITDALVRRAVDAGLNRATPHGFWDSFNESDHPREGGKFAAKGAGSTGSSHASKEKIGVSALKEKLEGMSHEKLTASLKNPQVDPKIKKHIEKELDDRANRGTMKGHRE